MSFDEFKGWLRGYLELTDGIHEDHQNRILEELEKVNEVEAAPVVIQPLCPPPAPWRPLGPYEVDPYPGRPYRLQPGTAVPPASWRPLTVGCQGGRENGTRV